MARNIADDYWKEAKNHYQEEDLYIKPRPDEETVMNIDWSSIPEEAKQNKLKEIVNKEIDDELNLFYLLECYIDDFITLIQCTDEKRLH